MAYSKSTNFAGLELSSSFFLITNYQCNAGNVLTVRVSMFASKEAFQEGLTSLDQKEYQIPLEFGEEKDSDKMQAYKYLLRLPENQNAVIDYSLD